MSAPLYLKAEDLKAMSDFLQGLTQLTVELGPVLEGYSGLLLKSSMESSHGLSIAWDSVAGEYVIDDRSGD